MIGSSDLVDIAEVGNPSAGGVLRNNKIIGLLDMPNTRRCFGGMVSIVFAAKIAV